VIACFLRALLQDIVRNRQFGINCSRRTPVSSVIDRALRENFWSSNRVGMEMDIGVPLYSWKIDDPKSAIETRQIFRRWTRHSVMTGRKRTSDSNRAKIRGAVCRRHRIRRNANDA
jgi:hypothetical protein